MTLNERWRSSDQKKEVMNSKNQTTIFKEKILWIYLIKFAAIFCICYFGTLAMIGLASPVGWYSPFVEKYLDYVTWIKLSLIHATGFILSLFNLPTQIEPGFVIRFPGGWGVIIAMDCVGYGVYSFWIAFVAANNGRLLRKILWIVFGLLGLWFINVIRITLFLTSLNKGWPMPLGLDHHTWFNIFAYALIFFMIGLFDKSLKKDQLKTNSAKSGK
jgi:exosortase/archaeosortase family protein